MRVSDVLQCLVPPWIFTLLQVAAPEGNNCWCCHPTSLIGSRNCIYYGRSTHNPTRPPSTHEWAQSFFANSWVCKIYFMIYVRLTWCRINRVLSLLLPAAFFTALDTGFTPPGTTDGAFSNISDETRGNLLKISRGIAILLLIVWVFRHFSRSLILIYSLFSYICSRFYLHNPPGKSDELTKQVTAPLILSQKKDPEVNQWVCLAMLIICIGIMAATVEWVGNLLTDA